jgi:hypothetical protein
MAVRMQTVARQVSGAFDWTPDGRALVFMAPLGGEGEKLQSIHRLTVIEENGSLAKPGKPVTLATAVTLNRPGGAGAGGRTRAFRQPAGHIARDGHGAGIGTAFVSSSPPMAAR